jgi:hypothetical protein
MLGDFQANSQIIFSVAFIGEREVGSVEILNWNLQAGVFGIFPVDPANILNPIVGECPEPTPNPYCGKIDGRMESLPRGFRYLNSTCTNKRYLKA